MAVVALAKALAAALAGLLIIVAVLVVEFNDWKLKISLCVFCDFSINNVLCSVWQSVYYDLKSHLGGLRQGQGHVGEDVESS